MRKYAFLKNPMKCNKSDYIYKIMIYQTKKGGFFLFQYCSIDAIQCSFDQYYNDLEDVYDDWNDEIDERGWIDINDPLPFCQHDAFIPIRVKGRDIGKPEWGKLETLVDGEWVEYKPK
ncbi:MAG: hypothetical protein IK999_06355 [Ruminococcus sp.]|nr:hypothetical protein [Ruminococcus sp.]